MVAAPILWNNLPLEIKRVPNIDNFKILVTTFLFKKAFFNIYLRFNKVIFYIIFYIGSL